MSFQDHILECDKLQADGWQMQNYARVFARGDEICIVMPDGKVIPGRREPPPLPETSYQIHQEHGTGLEPEYLFIEATWKDDAGMLRRMRSRHIPLIVGRQEMSMHGKNFGELVRAEQRRDREKAANAENKN